MDKTTVNTGKTTTTQPVNKKKVVESVYSVAELAKAASTNAELFEAGVTPDIVTAAFFVAGKNEATKNEARKIVKAFMKGGIK